MSGSRAVPKKLFIIFILHPVSNVSFQESDLRVHG